MASPNKPLPSDSITGEGPLMVRLEEALSLPIPARSDYWSISLPNVTKRLGSQLFGLVKKDLPDPELDELRKLAAQSPGNTLALIQKQLKFYPYNPSLLMLSAICTHGINVNSANPLGMFSALKLANRDAASALIYDGVSLYNAENFFRLYHLLMERYKRHFDKLHKELRGEKLAIEKAKLDFAETLGWLLADEEAKASNIISHLKKRILSNANPHYFTFARIAKAAEAIEAGKPKEMVGFFNATETITFVYAMAVAFARVPILHPLIDRLLEAMPASNLMLALRRVSISSVRLNLLMKLAVAEKAEERMRQIGRILFQENMAAVNQMEPHGVFQAFEADPFINLATATINTAGLFQGGEQAKMVAVALTAMESLVKKDQSKAKNFAQTAQSHIRVLSNMNREDAAR